MSNINIDFPFILTMLVVFAGIFAIVHRFYILKRRGSDGAQPLPRFASLSVIAEYSYSLFPALLLVWIIRSFIIQPYRVPTGSLEPTVLPGDFIAVKQFSYGLRMPVLNTKIKDYGEPKRGDIALFRWPVDPSILFVKRVVGVPGDHVVYKNKILTINNEVMPQTVVQKIDSFTLGGAPLIVEKRSENLGGIKHEILVKSDSIQTSDIDVVVPQGQYFMMGDNRDDSDDSRFWGFVPETNLVGKAFGIWMSWNPDNKSIRWNRIGKAIH